MSQKEHVLDRARARLDQLTLDQPSSSDARGAASSSDRLRALAPIILLLARLLVGGTFLIAGLTKVQSPGAFADAVRAYHILPPDLVLPFALVLPWLELLAAVYLLLGFMARLASVGTAVMLSGFVYALSVALATGNTAHACGCFGQGALANPAVALLAGGNTVTWWDVIRDLLLLGLSLLVVVRGAGAISLDALLRRRRHSGDVTAPGMEL